MRAVAEVDLALRLELVREHVVHEHGGYRELRVHVVDVLARDVAAVDALAGLVRHDRLDRDGDVHGLAREFRADAAIVGRVIRRDVTDDLEAELARVADDAPIPVGAERELVVVDQGLRLRLEPLAVDLVVALDGLHDVVVVDHEAEDWLAVVASDRRVGAADLQHLVDAVERVPVEGLDLHARVDDDERVRLAVLALHEVRVGGLVGRADRDVTVGRELHERVVEEPRAVGLAARHAGHDVGPAEVDRLRDVHVAVEGLLHVDADLHARLEDERELLRGVLDVAERIGADRVGAPRGAHAGPRELVPGVVDRAVLREAAGVVRERRDRINRLPLVETRGLVDRSAEDAALVDEPVVQLELATGDAVVPEARDHHQLLLDQGVYGLDRRPHDLREAEHLRRVHAGAAVRPGKVARVPAGVSADTVLVQLRQRAEVPRPSGPDFVQRGAARRIEVDHAGPRLVRARDVRDVRVRLREGRVDAGDGTRRRKHRAGAVVEMAAVRGVRAVDEAAEPGIALFDECVCHFGLLSAPLRELVLWIQSGTRHRVRVMSCGHTKYPEFAPSAAEGLHPLATL